MQNLFLKWKCLCKYLAFERDKSYQILFSLVTFHALISWGSSFFFNYSHSNNKIIQSSHLSLEISLHSCTQDNLVYQINKRKKTNHTCFTVFLTVNYVLIHFLPSNIYKLDNNLTKVWLYICYTVISFLC